MTLSGWQVGVQQATAGWTGHGVTIFAHGVWIRAWLIGRWGDNCVVRLRPVRGKPHRVGTIIPERVWWFGHSDPLRGLKEITL